MEKGTDFSPPGVPLSQDAGGARKRLSTASPALVTGASGFLGWGRFSHWVIERFQSHAELASARKAVFGFFGKRGEDDAIQFRRNSRIQRTGPRRLLTHLRHHDVEIVRTVEGDPPG